MSKLNKILERHEIWIPILLGLFFVLITLPGIAWGTPSIWHPDELIHRVLKALAGDWRFDELNFDYPSLPKYVMYGVGKVVLTLGGTQQSVIIITRLISAILGAGVVALVYRITRLAGGNIYSGLLASTLLISNSQMAINARWAHNDLYLLFFVTLSLFALIKYCSTDGHRIWLYLSFLCAGLAGSSKYNGGIILLAPIVLYLFLERKRLGQQPLRIFETIFIGLVLSGFGFAIGTPKALFWMAYYFKRLGPALYRHSVFGKNPESVIGALRQWVELPSFWGGVIFFWMLVALVSTIILLLKRYRRDRDLGSRDIAKLAIIVALMALDLPILFSYNIQLRFFLPQAPMLVVLAALLTQDIILYAQLHHRDLLAYALIGIITLLIAYSFLRVISVSLLLANDARVSASDYLPSLAVNSAVEYTYYPPRFPEEYFSSITSYPLVMINIPGQETPEHKHYELNVGEPGVEERKPDYLVFDSFTVDRFEDDYLCSLHPTDCRFFNRLKAGETHYQLIATFEYSLPRFLPNPEISFVNPKISIYQRVSGIE